ncbi:MAG: SixA phosphatase family protein [Ferruginibacter sp.]
MNKPYLILFLFVYSVQSIATAQPVPKGVSTKTRIYLVRHAEKASDGTNNPPLTIAGFKRAGDLARQLQHNAIQRIYVTQYQRTQLTADSLQLLAAIDTLHYLAEENGQELFLKMRQQHDFGHRVLIVGHSDTVPDYLIKLGVANYSADNIPATEFDNLFLFYYKRNFPLWGKWRAHLKKTKYGNPSIQ